MSAGPLVVEMLVVLVGTVGLLHRYGHWGRQHPIVSLSVLVGWYFAFLLVFVLPLDVSLTFYTAKCGPQARNASASVNGTEGPVGAECRAPGSLVPPPVLLHLWQVVYWSSQALTWLVLPVMQSYAAAGEFTVWARVKTAMLENALFYGSYVLIFALLLFYVLLKGLMTINLANLKTLGITASNTWGMLLLVFLLGYGLVEIPRQVFNAGTRGHRLQKLYFDLEKASSEKNDAEEALREAYRDSLELEGTMRTGHPLRSHAETILAKFPASLVEQMEGRRETPRSHGEVFRDTRDGLRDTDAANIGADSEKALVRLHRRAITSLQAHQRTQAQWAALVSLGLHLEEVAKNESMPPGGSKEFVRSPALLDAEPRSKLASLLCSPGVEWWWECRLKRPLLKAAGVGAACMSVFLVWSECTFFSTRPTLSLAALTVHAAARSNSYLYIELSSLLVLLYLSSCAYYTVFRLKFFSFYHLDPHGRTDSNSLIFAAMLLCRLTPPIALNFLGMIHLDSHVADDAALGAQTQFTTLMGHLDLVPLVSRGVNVYFPIAILLLCLGTYFKLGTRLLHEAGLEQFVVEDDMTTEMVEGGKRLLQTERNRLQRTSNRQEREAYLARRQRDGPGERKGAAQSYRLLAQGQEDEYSDTAPIVLRMEPSPSAHSYGSETPSTKGIFDDL